MSERLRELLAAADPARGVQVGPGDVEAVLDRARDDVTSYATAVPPRRRAWWVVPVAALAVVATAVVVVRGVGGPPASPQPYLPPGSTSESAPCLAEIADQLAATPYDGRTGRYEYLRMTWAGGGSVEMPVADAGMATIWYSEETTRWLAEDGSGRLRQVRGTPTYPDEKSREYFEQHRELTSETTRTTELAPGDLDVTALPAADPTAMAQALYRPRENGPAQALASVADLNRERVLDSAHRAAVLRFLAATDGVVCQGEDTDSVGRTGVAVSAGRGQGPRPSPAGHDREYLLFDPRTGELLASGAKTTTAGNVEVGTVYLERGRTDELG
ncbi:hypothetical protein C1I95_18435 [Micromonospora craterilacus]|uniref:CU044_5270 family protein n=1 Tax=Micromonospora craterilacus TaxID=1655439 RepID=A0A2W2EGP9_9ACTN|nr:CU044_5270 family protein [Micromonospora craterilacus]PZG16055.1 hypothetical protein C1I95_18435 [Micromonospora craterilacus]